MSGVYVYRNDSQPYAQVPNQVIRDPQITPNAFRLLAYLMSHKDGYQLTYDQIERQTTLGRHAINQAIKLLTTKGWLKVDRPKKSNGQFDSKAWYVLNPYEVAETATVDDSTVESPHVVQSTDIKNTNKNKKTNINTYTNEFDDFWKLYPRKVGKPAALRAWKKALEKKPPGELVKALSVYVEHHLPSEERYIPYPATWLNDERWESIQPEPKKEEFKFGVIK